MRQMGYHGDILGICCGYHQQYPGMCDLGYGHWSAKNIELGSFMEISLGCNETQCIYIYIHYIHYIYIYIYISRFPKMVVTLNPPFQWIVIFIFHSVNHPAIGDPPMEIPLNNQQEWLAWPCWNPGSAPVTMIGYWPNKQRSGILMGIYWLIMVNNG